VQKAEDSGKCLAASFVQNDSLKQSLVDDKLWGFNISGLFTANAVRADSAAGATLHVVVLAVHFLYISWDETSSQLPSWEPQASKT